MNYSKKIKLLIFGILLSLFCVPFIQEKFRFAEVWPLNGVVNSTPMPYFTFKDWYSGDFQKNYEAYFEENAGFKNTLIRWYNQIEYKIFNEAHAGNVVIGLDGYLFETDYIDEITGRKFVGAEKMDYKVRRLKEAQDILEGQNKIFFAVLAPGKASFFKEFIPAWRLNSENVTTNYSSFIEKSKAANLNVLDFNNWFRSMKDTSSYPLFPTQGIHWSYYGMALAADSIFNYISSNGIKPLTQMTWTLELPDTLRGTDSDIGDLLNLQYQMPYRKMAYPVFNYSAPDGVKMPKVMIIGDSYVWTLINSEVFHNVFGKYIYFYYFKSTNAYNGAEEVSLDDMNLLDEIKNYDIVMSIQSEGNYNDIGFGFEERLLNEVAGMKNIKQEVFKKVSNDPVYKPFIKKIMVEKNLDREHALSYLADSLSNIKNDIIKGIFLSMKKDSVWLETLRVKAEKSNISLEEAMNRDAEWLYDRDYNK